MMQEPAARPYFKIILSLGIHRHAEPGLSDVKSAKSVCKNETVSRQERKHPHRST
jgi:hypothetical protein